MTTRASARQHPTVSDVGERALIERIHALLPPAPPWLVVGIGDDAAVAQMDRGAFTVLTTDALVEGIHFDRRFSSAADIGHKALAVNASDLAAMGAAPRLALLSLMLPADLSLADVEAMVSGLAALANAVGVTLAGGNITRSPGPLVVDVTAVGVAKPRKFLTRNGGRAGDELYVSGQIGAGTAGLEWLRAHGTSPASQPDDDELGECVRRHRRPEPRTRLGMLLGRSRAANACMDLSDGLADAVRQVAAASGVGARIEAEALPIHPGAARWFVALGQDAVRASLAGGDDYELLVAVPKRRGGRLRTVISQARGLPLTRIGELTADRGSIVLRRNGGLEPLPEGFVHF
ncbi:MAG TPA: thiamine-phosphate kinase [Vicinamibacterales bacterium]|nr:thiamine-phosphate kinase [Vicinamibacterales bacterium]